MNIDKNSETSNNNYIKRRRRRRRMVKSTSKRIVVIAVVTALLAMAVAPALSQSENDSKRKHTNDRISRNTRQQVGEVPTEIVESMDQKLIDFVIAGFPKCGTTYLQNHIFYESPSVFIPHHETHYLANDKYEEFRNEFSNANHNNSSRSSTVVVGYKSPFELGHEKSLRNLQALFPNIKMIVALRHPIWQFQSLYNYQLRHLPELIPSVDAFVGDCREQCLYYDDDDDGRPSKCLPRKAPFCTGQASYHQYLSRLGLTPMDTPEELELLDHHNMSIHPFPNWRITANTDCKKCDNDDDDDDDHNQQEQQQSFLRSKKAENKHDTNARNTIKSTAHLFLMEIGQFDNWFNQSMTDDLHSDLEAFLGLEVGDLPRAPLREPGSHKPQEVYEYPPGREEHKLDICLNRYKPLRDTLLETSRKAADWILHYLLHPSNRNGVVVVSNPDIFQRLVEGWKMDPCASEEDTVQ